MGTETPGQTLGLTGIRTLHRDERNFAMTSYILIMQFNNPSIQSKIQETYGAILRALEEARGRLYQESTPLSVTDILCLPDCGGLPNIGKDTMNRIQADFASDRNPEWKRHGRIYNQIQCAVMDKVWEFWRAATLYGLDLSITDPGPDFLQKLGAIAIKPSTTLAVKYAWLYFIQRDSGWNSDNGFYGHVSSTTPVREYFRRNFGFSNVPLHDADRITFQIAAETGLDPVDVNTAMWLMGRN